MKGIERFIWIALVVGLSISTATVWALWKSTEEVLGNEQYLNAMHALRLQQKLNSSEIQAATQSNQEWLAMYWKSFQAQQQFNALLMSEENFTRLRNAVDESQLDMN